MTHTPNHSNDAQPCPAPASRAIHPRWCDRSRCTANPDSQANGYHAGVGGEHRSASVLLDLSCAMWLLGRSGQAWLTEAVAPWRCATYLRIRIGDAEAGMAVDDAAPVLSVLSGLLMAANATLLILTGLFVAGLATVAGAISFAHMRDLALHHDQLGWKAFAFPVSVDGLEIVASLYLVTRHRAGRPTGWVRWVALVVGTLASLAANVAVGGHDVLGKALAGWPAVSMLAAVKLLFSMFEREDAVPRTVRDGGSSTGTVPAQRTDGTDSSATGAAGRAAGRASDPGSRAAPADLRTVAHLIPAARAARQVLASDGRSLSRDNLADALRDGGRGVSNERASLLLRILKAEGTVTPLAPISVPARREPDEPQDGAA
jgi:hypothetical protein